MAITGSASDVDAAAAASSAGGTLTRAAGLRKSYDGRTMVLDGVDLAVMDGERMALIGANGSGKSTLLKCLIGLHDISGGSVETLGERFSRAPSARQRARLRRRTGFVFQKHCLVRRRSVLSNVIHGLLGESGSWRGFCHATAPADWRYRAMAALEEVRLADKAMARADALSGGQQQRVAIARALVRRPRLLIADEPAASLDPVSGRKVMELFVQLCEEHRITVVFTSHDMKHAAEFATCTVALKMGRVLFHKRSGEVGDADLQATFND